MATVHIVQGTHHTIPGSHLSAHASREGAVLAAMELVTLIMGRKVRPDNWQEMIQRFGEIHDGADVWIDETELRA